MRLLKTLCWLYVSPRYPPCYSVCGRYAYLPAPAFVSLYVGPFRMTPAHLVNCPSAPPHLLYVPPAPQLTRRISALCHGPPGLSRNPRTEGKERQNRQKHVGGGEIWALPVAPRYQITCQIWWSEKRGRKEGYCYCNVTPAPTCETHDQTSPLLLPSGHHTSSRGYGFS